jgi:muconate cycloisomerase
MKIKRIECFPLILPIAEVYGGAAGFLEDCRSLFIRIEVDSGIVGWGEATQGRPGNTYETLETMQIMIERYFAPVLAGLDVEETGAALEALHRVRCGHPVTKAAVETALLDALGKLYRVPVYRLLGGPYRTEIDLVGGLGLDLDARTIGEHVKRLKRDGFKTFKLKIGQADLSRDIERVGIVRDAAGAEANIRVDGNASYSFADARDLLGALARFRITDAEQPLARADLESLADLRRAVAVPIAAQESIGSPEDVLAVVKHRAADLIKIKLTHIGGFHRALQVAAVAGAAGMSVVVGQGSACTPLLSVAEMHLHASMKNAEPAGEMTGFLRLAPQEFVSPLFVDGARVAVPDGPGLGIAVDEERLRRIAVAAP